MESRRSNYVPAARGDSQEISMKAPVGQGLVQNSHNAGLLIGRETCEKLGERLGNLRFCCGSNGEGFAVGVHPFSRMLCFAHG